MDLKAAEALDRLANLRGNDFVDAWRVEVLEVLHDIRIAVTSAPVGPQKAEPAPAKKAARAAKK